MYGARVFSYRSLSTLIIDGCGARVLESCCFAVPVCRKSMIGHGRSLRSKGPPQENIHPHTYIHTYYTYYVQSHPDKRTTQTLFTDTIDIYIPVCLFGVCLWTGPTRAGTSISLNRRWSLPSSTGFYAAASKTKPRV